MKKKQIQKQTGLCSSYIYKHTYTLCHPYKPLAEAPASLRLCPFSPRHFQNGTTDVLCTLGLSPVPGASHLWLHLQAAGVPGACGEMV